MRALALLPVSLGSTPAALLTAHPGFRSFPARIPVRGGPVDHARERPVHAPAPYQCTPRISAANAICSLLGAASPFSAALSPRAAAESGNSSNAVFITTS